MKRSEIKVGGVYAYHGGNVTYGLRSRATILRAETQLVRKTGRRAFGTKEVRGFVAHVERMHAQVDEMFVAPRDLASTWAEYEKQQEARDARIEQEQRRRAERALEIEPLVARARPYFYAVAYDSRSHRRAETELLADFDQLQHLVHALEAHAALDALFAKLEEGILHAETTGHGVLAVFDPLDLAKLVAAARAASPINTGATS